MFDAVIPIFPQQIDAEAVGLRINDLEEASADIDELAGIKQAFEDRVLHTLTIIKARPGRAAKSAPARGSDGGDIVGNEHLHGGINSNSAYSLPDKRGVGIEIAAQMAREKTRLQVGHNSPRHFLLKEGMDEFLPLPLLPGNQYLLARILT